MKKLILFLIILIFTSSCFSSKKTEKKSSNDKLKSESLKKEEAKKEDLKDSDKKDDKSIEPDKKADVENISSKKDSTNKDKKELQKPEKKELTNKDKVSINKEIKGFLNLEPKEKLDKLDELLKKYPDSDILYFYKAKLYFDLNDSENSLFNINKSLSINPANASSLELMFLIKLKTSEKDAEAFLFSMLRKFPEDYKVMVMVIKGIIF